MIAHDDMLLVRKTHPTMLNYGELSANYRRMKAGRVHSMHHKEPQQRRKKSWLPAEMMAYDEMLVAHGMHPTGPPANGPTGKRANGQTGTPARRLTH
jgi:hypothetical protein